MGIPSLNDRYFYRPILLTTKEAKKMSIDIIINDEIKTTGLTCIDAELVEITHPSIKNRNIGFTHELKVKSPVYGLNKSNHAIYKIILCHFDFIDDEDKRTKDKYALRQDFVCQDGESGLSNEWLIEDMMDTKKFEISANSFVVTYNLKLSNKKTIEF